MRPRFLADALEELIEAVQYYARENAQIAIEMQREVEVGLDLICAFPKVAKSIGRFYRGHKLPRFPYFLIYRIDSDNDEIVIVAIAHMSRHPDYWRSRDAFRQQ
jgi:plasmid stabilization system protein ParE